MRRLRLFLLARVTTVITRQLPCWVVSERMIYLKRRWRIGSRSHSSCSATSVVVLRACRVSQLLLCIADSIGSISAVRCAVRTRVREQDIITDRSLLPHVGILKACLIVPASLASSTTAGVRFTQLLTWVEWAHRVAVILSHAFVSKK